MKTTSEKMSPLGQWLVRNPSATGSPLTLREPVLRTLSAIEPPAGSFTVEVRPDKELPAGLCVGLRRILVPIVLDDSSAAALGYASKLALRFGSELALLYAFQASPSTEASRTEAELWTCFSEVRVQHPKARLFLHSGLVCEQVKAVANTLSADLLVMSREYYRQFLSYFVQAETDSSRVQSFPCPVVLVNGGHSGMKLPHWVQAAA